MAVSEVALCVATALLIVAGAFRIMDNNKQVMLNKILNSKWGQLGIKLVIGGYIVMFVVKLIKAIA